MTEVLSLGAINKNTGEYVYPKIANKKDKYFCGECNKDVILCQGEVRVHHFRHKIDHVNPCHRYNSPSETQIHKDAQSLLKKILERKIPISFIRICCCCKNTTEFEIQEITESSVIQLEYRFDYNGVKIADVAYLEDGELLCIFEICNTHKTCSEDRPEPWFEIDAKKLIRTANDNHLTSIQIPCMRCEKCEDCIETEKNNIIKKNQALEIMYDWFQTGDKIAPFIYDYAPFAGVEKNIKCSYTGDLFDLILYVEPEGDYKWERYCIHLIHCSSKFFFTEDHDMKEKERVDYLTGVYFVDINWVLSQTSRPNRIQYIASLDCFNHTTDTRMKCHKCYNDGPFWVRRIFERVDGRVDEEVSHIGCICCGYNKNSKSIHCERCKSRELIWVMGTNIHTHFCKSCDIECWQNIYLNVDHREKDEAKILGALWDSMYKKWFIHKDHKNKEIVLQKWGINWSTIS